MKFFGFTGKCAYSYEQQGKKNTCSNKVGINDESVNE